jgi:NTE family protein
MRYFESRDGAITVRHVMASGALPPAFPAVRIDDNPRKNSLIFSVHLWNPADSEPTTMAEVFNRHKDVFEPDHEPDRAAGADPSAASRHQPASHTPAGGGAQQRCGARIGKLWLPDPDACGAPACSGARSRKPYQGHRLAPWVGEFDPLSGVVFHEHMEMMPQAAE